VYPTQYSKIVIEVKYYACPTSEFNGWVKRGRKRRREKGKEEQEKREE
jgi:hypothetical protein